MSKLLLQNKMVYGKVLTYPKNQLAEDYAALLGRKTFSELNLRALLKCGLEFEYLPDLDFVGADVVPEPRSGMTGFTFGPEHAAALREKK